MGDKVEQYQPPLFGQTIQPIKEESTGLQTEEKLEKGSFSFRLEDLAYARSGDKGNNCNIGEIS